MGEAFLRKQARQFAHQQDREYAELERPDLLSRLPVNFARAVNCASNSAPPEVGQPVVLLRQVDTVDVIVGNEVVGHVREVDMPEVEQLMSDNPMAADMLSARVDDCSELTGDFSVRLDGASDDSDGE